MEEIIKLNIDEDEFKKNLIMKNNTEIHLKPNSPPKINIDDTFWNQHSVSCQCRSGLRMDTCRITTNICHKTYCPFVYWIPKFLTSIM